MLRSRARLVASYFAREITVGQLHNCFAYIGTKRDGFEAGVLPRDVAHSERASIERCHLAVLLGDRLNWRLLDLFDDPLYPESTHHSDVGFAIWWQTYPRLRSEELDAVILT